MTDYLLKFPVPITYISLVLLCYLEIIFSLPISSLLVANSNFPSRLWTQTLSPLSERATVPELAIIAIRNRRTQPFTVGLTYPVTTPSATASSVAATVTSGAVVLVPSIRLRINSTGKSFTATTTTTRWPRHLLSGPVFIGHLCYFTEQCQRIHPLSTCYLTHGTNRTCVCPPGTFVARNRTACLSLPTSIGDLCFMDYHCEQKISNSFCDDNSCNCSVGYFADNNKTTCHPDPQQFGDFCQSDTHCERNLNWSKCELENNTCVCKYGYTQVTARSCVERQPLPSITSFAPPTVTVCETKCNAWTNSRCVKPSGLLVSYCRCNFRHARAYNSTECVPVQTYEFDLSLVKNASTYDYVVLQFKPEYLSPKVHIYQRFANRITMSGLMMMFEESSSSLLQDRYVASEVTRFQNLDKSNQSTNKGVKATILLHLTANYLDATPVSDIYNFFEENLNASDGLLGKSGLKVATPFRDALTFRDYDECALPERHDCSKHATCINTLGSFMCVCKSRYEDVSKLRNLLPGRDCVIPSTTDTTSDLCSSDDCETRWEFVGLAVTLFLLIVMSFITYEIIQRKQTFTARKLYEKFGTTKIRKLRQASMQRLQERKKRKKEENQKKKDDEKQKKDELKREKSEKRKLKDDEKKLKQDDKKQQDLEKKETKRAQKGKSDDDVEWLGDSADMGPASPVEIMHPPSQLFAMTSEDNLNVDNSLPGNVSTPEIEMGFPRRAVSPIEESPV